MLDLADLSSGYGETQVLHGLTLRAEPGRVLAILGRNGAGKSTTLKTIMGLLPAKGGSVSFDGKTISGMTPFDIAKLGIAYVPETRDIFRSLSVRENL
ncbi:ATP-binding cassette domain-containing protein, partial [Pseudotabrizicola sp.]